MRALGLVVLLGLCPPAAAAAQSAQFLKAGVGARAMGLAGAYTALGDDASSLYWNPAGLARMDQRELAVSHAELFDSTRLDFLGYAQPAPQGTFSAAVTYLSQPSLEGRDDLGRPTGDFQASDAALSLGYGRALEFVDAGIAVKYLRGHIGAYEAQTIALDLGLRREVGGIGGGSLIFGAALRNLGPGWKYEDERDDLPLLAALGAAYRLSGGHALSIELIDSPRDEGFDAAFGGECRLVESVFARAGYTTRTSVSGGSTFDAAKGLTLGLGFRSRRWELSYAVLPMGELERSHRFGLGARF